MCHHCVIDSVKSRMLDRRSLFRSIAAAGAASAVAGPALAASHSEAKAELGSASFGFPTDLTHELHEQFPTFFGEQQLFIDRKFTYAEHKFNLNEVRVNEHTGTHLDAPLHFSADGRSVAEIPVEDLVVPLVVVDIRQKAAANPDAQVTPEDLKAWIAQHGPLPDRACVAMLSGWGQEVNGPKFRNLGADGKTMHFPGFHVEAAKMLLEESNAVGIAVDTLSLDFGPSPDFATHYAWLPQGRWGLECAANLDQLPPKGSMLVVGAPKIRGGSGGPSRAIAFAPAG